MKRTGLKTAVQENADRRRRGFERASIVLKDIMGPEAAKRGFTLTRILTCWREIAGPSIAEAAVPLSVTYGRDSHCGTLKVLVPGARATEIAMSVPEIIERVNTAHGFRAISDVRITQIRGRRHIRPEPADGPVQAAEPDEDCLEAVRTAAAAIEDSALRGELEALGRGLLARSR